MTARTLAAAGPANRRTGPAHRAAWLPVAAVLLGTGWGAQQFTPMLLVYSRTLGLTTGTLQALFGVYALSLIPGLLLGGPMRGDAAGWSCPRRRSRWPPAPCSPPPGTRWRCFSPGACWPG